MTGKDTASKDDTKSKTMKTKPSRLHDEIVAYAAQLTPTAEEHERCERVIEIIRKMCYELFGTQAQVVPFGSYANGLATSSSDVDLVICGLLWPDTPEGFFGDMHACAIRLLRVLEEKCRENLKLRMAEIQLIQHAKVPLLKFTTEDGVMVDLSINDDKGPRAARYMLEKVRQYPPLRSLVLVLKAFLKAYHLSEVKDGGLGGFALVNIIVAHIQETMKAGLPTHDYGQLMTEFFHRYAHEFDPEAQAVSVRRGGIVDRHWVDHQAAVGGKHSKHGKRGRCMGRWGSPMLGEQWVVENPVTGMDVAQGSFNIFFVRELFGHAHWTLQSVAPISSQKGGVSPLGLLFNHVV